MPADNLLEDLERAADSPADLERLLNQYRTFAPARRQRALELIQGNKLGEEDLVKAAIRAKLPQLKELQ